MLNINIGSVRVTLLITLQFGIYFARRHESEMNAQLTAVFFITATLLLQLKSVANAEETHSRSTVVSESAVRNAADRALVAWDDLKYSGTLFELQGVSERGVYLDWRNNIVEMFRPAYNLATSVVDEGARRSASLYVERAAESVLSGFHDVLHKQMVRVLQLDGSPECTYSDDSWSSYVRLASTAPPQYRGKCSDASPDSESAIRALAAFGGDKNAVLVSSHFSRWRVLVAPPPNGGDLLRGTAPIPQWSKYFEMEAIESLGR